VFPSLMATLVDTGVTAILRIVNPGALIAWLVR
jgi:hypothetical protein